MCRKIRLRDSFFTSVCAYALLLSALLVRGPVANASSYWRVSVDQITVIAVGGSGKCQKVASQFATLDRMLHELADLDTDVRFPPLTVYVLSDSDAQRVLLTKSERQQEAAQSRLVYSKFLPGRDFNIAALVDDGDIEEPLESVMLLYAQALLTGGPTRAYPPWYTLGIAYLTDGAIIRDDGSVLLSRNAPFQPDTTPGTHSNYDLSSLLSATASDLAGSGTDWNAFISRAREWAQFGLLTTPERRAHYRELAMLMRQGTPAVEAVSNSFQSTLDSVAKEFEQGKWRRAADFKLPPASSGTPMPPAQEIAAGQVDVLLHVIADRVAQHPG
jgi:hypothetical protein